MKKSNVFIKSEDLKSEIQEGGETEDVTIEETDDDDITSETESIVEVVEDEADDIETEYKEETELKEDTEYNNQCVYDKEEEFFIDTELEDDSTNDPIRVLDEDRITKNVMTIYEKTRLIGTRAKQISLGAKTLVKNPGTLTPRQLAETELMNDKFVWKIKRPLPNNTYEIWKTSELIKI